MKPTWKPHNDDKPLSADERNHLPDSVYAFPTTRKEPLTNASHVRNAIARFDQVKDVSDHDRDQAFANLQAAAKHYDVELTEKSWHDLGKKPHSHNPKH
jgi:cell division protein FtsX